MDGLLNKFIEKFWLKYKSLPVVAAILFIACIFTAPEKTSDSNVKFFAVLIVAIFVFVFYLICCIRENVLPKARRGNLAVLFVVDAESDQLYNDVMKKLVSDFSDCINCGNKYRFQAICVKIEQVRKYVLYKREDVIELLHSTRCVFFVHVKYRVDSVTHAENFEMLINYGVVHREFESSAKQILQSDMGILSEPIRKRRFNKTQTLDEFEFTAQALSVICQYVIGLVMLLSGRSIDAYEIFHRMSAAPMSKDAIDGVSGIQELVLKRLYSSCLSVAKLDMNLFYTEKSLAALDDLNMKLEEANSIIPDTYLYYLSKAYYYVAKETDIDSAKICVDKCKLMNQGTDWNVLGDGTAFLLGEA